MLETESDRLEMLKAVGELVEIDGESSWGVFEREYLEDLDGPGIASYEPTLTCRSSDAPGIEGVIKRQNGKSYSVREIEPDGTGITLLRLRDYG